MPEKLNVCNPLANVTLKLTDEQLAVFNEWFDENAKPLLSINDEPVNVVTIDQLGLFLDLKKFHRRSFSRPSYGEIMNEAEALNAGLTRMLTKDQILYILNKFIVLPSLKHELQLAFKVFDTEKRNFLEMDELQTIVTSYGEIFSEAETLELLRDANVRGDGNIFYDDFIESMFSVAPELHKIKAEYLYDDPDEDPSVPPEPIIVEELPPVEEPPPPQPPKKETKKGKKK